MTDYGATGEAIAPEPTLGLTSREAAAMTAILADSVDTYDGAVYAVAQTGAKGLSRQVA